MIFEQMHPYSSSEQDVLEVGIDLSLMYLVYNNFVQALL